MRRCCTSHQSFRALTNAHDGFARCPIGRGHSPRSRSHARPLRCPMSVACHADTDTGTSPQYPSTFPLHAAVSDRAVQPATRREIGHTGRDSTSRQGTLVPVRCPEGSPENVPSSFRGVPFTRMRHTIGQPRKRPAVRKPVDSPVCPFPRPLSRTACPFPGPLSRTLSFRIVVAS
jgi:hypothetical protein